MPSNKSKSIIKKPRQKEIIYPILHECSTLIKDKFWKQFYEDLSCSKSTKGLYISNGVIQTSNKRNGFHYSITDKAPEVIVKELHHLLTTYTNICSKKDLNQKRAIVNELEQELDAYDKAEWTSIKRKNIRNMLIVDYAISMRKKYNLQWSVTISAYHTILNAFENKTHTSKDVDYSNGKINYINDIEYNKESKNMVNIRLINFTNIKDTTTDLISENVDGITLQNMFENYVNAWLKHIKTS